MLDALFPPGWSTMKKLMWLLLMGAGGAGWKWTTVTGNPVTLSNAVAGPLRQLKVEFSPVQDLHGYDSPWPAGGGKNLISPVGIISGAINAAKAGNIDASTIRVVTDFIPVNVGSTYVASIESGKVYVCCHYYDSEKNGVSVNITNNPFTVPDGAAYVRLMFKFSDDSTISPSDVTQAQVELGSTASSFAPYANECPISGWTGVNVWRESANLIDWAHPFRTGSGYYSSSVGDEISAGTATGCTVTASDNVYTGATNAGWRFITWRSLDLKNGSYYLKYTYADLDWTGDSDGMDVFIVDAENTIVRKVEHASGNASRSLAITLSGNESAIVVSIGGRSGTYGTFTVTNPMLNLGDEAKPYQPYSGQKIAVAFPDGETYYAGWVDPTTGDGISTAPTMTEIDGTGWSTGTISGNSVFQHRRPSSLPNGADFLSNYITRVSSIGSTTPANSGYAGTSYINVYCPDLTLEEWTDLLDESPIQFLWRTSEPPKFVEFSVTPQQINSLAGTNNMWTDADTLTVEYRKDGNVSDVEALSMLLGGRYTPATGPEDVSDSEALRIITGGNR